MCFGWIIECIHFHVSFVDFERKTALKIFKLIRILPFKTAWGCGEISEIKTRSCSRFRSAKIRSPRSPAARRGREPHYSKQSDLFRMSSRVIRARNWIPGRGSCHCRQLASVWHRCIQRTCRVRTSRSHVDKFCGRFLHHKRRIWKRRITIRSSSWRIHMQRQDLDRDARKSNQHDTNDQF